MPQSRVKLISFGLVTALYWRTLGGLTTLTDVVHAMLLCPCCLFKDAGNHSSFRCIVELLRIDSRTLAEIGILLISSICIASRGSRAIKSLLIRFRYKVKVAL